MLDPNRSYINNLEYGYSFIEKFVQLSFRIPRPSSENIKFLLKNLSNTASGDGEKKSKLLSQRIFAQQKKEDPAIGNSDQETNPNENTATLLSRVRLELDYDSENVIGIIAALAPTLDYNPRKVKQFLNAFRLSAYLAEVTGQFDSSTDKNGLTLQKLAKLVLIPMKWPLLLSDLSTDKWLLSRLQLMFDFPKITSAESEIHLSGNIGRTNYEMTPLEMLNTERWSKRKDVMNFIGLGYPGTSSTGSDFSFLQIDIESFLNITKSIRTIQRKIITDIPYTDHKDKAVDRIQDNTFVDKTDQKEAVDDVNFFQRNINF